jgi:hypothetical protein
MIKFIVVAAVVVVALTGSEVRVVAQAPVTTPPVKPATGPKTWIRFEIPRIGLDAGYACVTDLPDSVRAVTEYKRPDRRHTLPFDTGGSLAGVSVGAGILVAQRVGLSYDAAFRNSYHGGRTTWSEIEFDYADDYIGYRYRGWDSTLSGTVDLTRYANGRIYVRSGIRLYHVTLSSGTDAYAEFSAQNSLRLNDRKSIVIAGGVRWWPAFGRLIVGLELEGTSGTAKPGVQELYFRLRFSLVP